MPRILAVDDDQAIRKLYQVSLGNRYEVEVAESGEKALAACAKGFPDLVLLDVGMPGLGGNETCRRLRDVSTVPIIFVTGHQDFEAHLRAYEDGGNDIVTKPFKIEILLHKIERAIAYHRETTHLREERDSLRKLAMGFLSSVGESGILLNFVRGSIGCRSYRALAERLIGATTELGLESCVLIRHEGGPTLHGVNGEPTPLEHSILEQVSQMGRVFQFRRRLVVNYDRVSILVSDMPEESADPERAGRLRDDVVVLAETTEGLCESVDMRIESMQRAERLQIALGGASDALVTMRRDYYGLLGDTRLRLQQLIDQVEHSFSWMGMSEENEREFIRTIHQDLDPLLSALAEGGNFESHFSHVMDALRGGKQSDAIELF